jgi:hypothetical protein
VLGWMSFTLGSLVLGVSLLAHFTHAIPYSSGSPTVISQVAHASFGHSPLGNLAFYIIQLSTLLILYTGGNTSFNGFPFLANFVATDRFMPRPFTKRGHRLVFSNGILFLGSIAIVLLVITRARVNDLVSLYAIGVFCGFAMAGAGMVKHHLTYKEPGYRHKIWINGSAAVVSALVVLIFAVTKFTEGAWAVVILFPVLMWVLIRTHKQYVHEATALGDGAAERAIEAKPLARHVALILVDNLDLATARVIQYARTMSVDELRAVHFVIDSARAQALADRWVRLGLSRLPLELIECPDRRVARAAVELAAEIASDGQTEVTVLMPRRSYAFGLGRILHDTVGERIAAAISRLDHVNATIVPFDARGEFNTRRRLRHDERQAQRERERVDQLLSGEEPAPSLDGAVPISSLQLRQRARVAGRVKSVTVKPWGDSASLQVQLVDDHGRMVVAFLGRRQIAGMVPGAKLAVEGTVADLRGQMGMINPNYEFLAETQRN